MRTLIRQFMEIVAKTLPIQEPIFEFGSLQVPGQEGFADLRPLFPGLEYVGCDLRAGPGVDRILDLHDIALPTESVGTALIIDTLEHVEYPRKALEEVHRILRSEGMVVITSVMNCRIHNYPHDYWRFTPMAFESLLSVFPRSFVGFAGDAEFPHTVAGIGFKNVEISLERFMAQLEPWQLHWSKPVRLNAKGVLVQCWKEVYRNLLTR